MSDDDVHSNEMNAPHDFDDATAEALIAGSGRDVDRALADLVGDMRVAYTSTPPAVGASLAALMASPPGRLERMRSSMIAKMGVAAAAVVAATGGLAVAGALPAPVQDAMSHIGVGESSHHDSQHADAATDDDSTTTSVEEPTSTTSVEGATSTTVEDHHADNHGDDVSGVAHDHDVEGCEHGHAVAAVASDGKSNGKPCPTTTTTVGNGTTPTTTVDGSDDDANENHDGDHQTQGDDGDHGEHGNHGGPPTTIAGGSHDHGGGPGGDHGGDDNGD